MSNQLNQQVKTKQFHKAISEKVIEQLKVPVIDEDTGELINKWIFVVECHWKIPRKKDLYFFIIPDIYKILISKGIYFENAIHALRIFSRMRKDECKKMIVWDNRKNTEQQILAYWQDNAWIKLTHEQSQLVAPLNQFNH